MDCTICARLAKQQPIHENKHWVATAAMGERPGWLIVAARRHFEGVWNMTKEEAQSFGPAIHIASKMLQQAADTAKVYMVGLGEGAAHCHFMLIPRVEGLGQDIRAALKSWGDIVSDPKEAVEIQQKFRASA